MNCKKIIFKVSFLPVILLSLFLFSPLVSKASSFDCLCSDKSKEVADSYAKCDTFCKSVSASVSSYSEILTSAPAAGGATLPNPLGTTNINTFAARIISYVLGLVGTISLLFFIYGGLIWMTSTGSADKIKKGRDILVWAVIGMAVVFTAYILVKFVIQGVQGTF